MKDTTLCAGCQNNFYNGNNDFGVKRCWSADTALVATRYTLSTNTPMWFREAYRRELLPSCYKRPGYVHLDAIPDYAKTAPERKEINEREAERAAREAAYVPPPPRPYSPVEISDDCPF